MKEVTNISKNHVDENKVTTIIATSILVKVKSLFVSSIIIDLFNRYYFNESLTLLVGDTSNKYRMVNDVPIKTDINYIMCIDIHNKILLIDENTFNQHIAIDNINISSNIIVTNEFTDELCDILDNKTLTTPVLYYINGTSDTKQYIELYYNSIYINIHDKRYSISREIFDMLYVESEDFVPTDDICSGIIIKTQARHQIYNDGYYSTDLLHSDIGLICDIQDKLIIEHCKISKEDEE